MIITLKYSKTEVTTIEMDAYFLSATILFKDIYQNSKEIKNIVMEKTPVLYVGCRYVGIYRLISARLNKLGKSLTFEEYDKIADEGGLLGDAWVDGTNSNPIYDVIDVGKLVKKINKKLGVKLKYEIIRKYNQKTKDRINWLLNNGIGLVVKMDNPYSPNYKNHFVNIDGYVLNYRDDELYLKMKETYKSTRGYDGYYIKWNSPDYYEVIV